MNEVFLDFFISFLCLLLCRSKEKRASTCAFKMQLDEKSVQFPSSPRGNCLNAKIYVGNS